MIERKRDPTTDQVRALTNANSPYLAALVAYKRTIAIIATTAISAFGVPKMDKPFKAAVAVVHEMKR